jgi:hypothetical protein
MSAAHDDSLLQKIVKQNSIAKNWDDIVKEWELDYIFKKRDGKCICNVPITDHCVIRNKCNHARLIVGNVCVEKFNPLLGKKTKSLFRALQDLQKNHKVKVNLEFLDFCIDHNILDQKWGSVYKELWRKRKLSVKQANLLTNLNQSIVVAFMNETKNCPTCDEIVFAKISRKNELYYHCRICN